MPGNEVVKLAVLRELASAGSVKRVEVIGEEGGYAVNVGYGVAERTLAGKDGKARLFKTIDTAASTLRKAGIEAFVVSANKVPIGRMRAARPDLAERMRRSHQAGAHDEWFRSQVEATKEKGEAPIPQAQAEAALAAFAASLAAGRDQKELKARGSVAAGRGSAGSRASKKKAP